MPVLSNVSIHQYFPMQCKPCLRTRTTPTAAQTSRLTATRVVMIAMTGKGSFLRYGIPAWYIEALFDALRKKEGLFSGSLPAFDEGREAISTTYAFRGILQAINHEQGS